MFKFNHFDGIQQELKVKFHHVGKKKGKSPTATLCEIRNNRTNELISSGLAKPVSEIPVIVHTTEKLKNVLDQYGRRVKRVLTDDTGTKVVIIKADQFSRAVGRREALKKALSFLPPKHTERRQVWENYFAKFGQDG